VHSALETFVIIALYKSTFTIPYHTARAIQPFKAASALNKISSVQFSIQLRIVYTRSKKSRVVCSAVDIHTHIPSTTGLPPSAGYRVETSSSSSSSSSLSFITHKAAHIKLNRTETKADIQASTQRMMAESRTQSCAEQQRANRNLAVCEL